MKTLYSFFLMSLFLVFGSCGETAEREVETEDENMAVAQEIPDPEVVIRNWEQAWKSNDSTGLWEMTGEDAILVLNGNEFPKDSIASWMKTVTSQMTDLEIESLQKGFTDEIAYDTGTYSHATTTDTTHVGGTYTFIWERSNEQNDWKVKVMNIAETQPMEPQ